MLALGADVVVSDGALAGTAAAAAAVAYAVGGTAPLQERWARAEWMEVRLDITTVWCFHLLGVLLQTRPSAVSLGYTSEDVLELAQIFSSGCCLSVAWLAVGLLTRVFERRGDTLGEFLAPTVPTAVVSGGAWRVLEAISAAPEPLVPALDVGADSLAVSLLTLSMLVYRWFSFYIP